MMNLKDGTCTSLLTSSDGPLTKALKLICSSGVAPPCFYPQLVRNQHFVTTLCPDAQGTLWHHAEAQKGLLYHVHLCQTS